MTELEQAEIAEREAYAAVMAACETVERAENQRRNAHERHNEAIRLLTIAQIKERTA